MTHRINFLLVLCLLVSFAARGESDGVVGVRGNEADTKRFAEEYGVPILPAVAKEFSNLDTGVRLETSVAHKDVYVHIPPVLTPTQAMEALMLAETARTNFAENVILAAAVKLADVRVVDSKGQVIPMNLARLFRIAGVDTMVRDGRDELTRGRISMKRVQKPPTPKGAYVMDLGHPELAENVAKDLGLPHYKNPADAPPTGQQVYLVIGMIEPRNEIFLRLLSEMERLRAAGNTVHVVSPYLFYARSDKIDRDFTAVEGGLVVRLMRGEGGHALTFFRSHAPQSQGFFTGPSRQLMGYDTVMKHLFERGVSVVVSPDAGFQKDATKYADHLKLNKVAVINKQRDPLSGKIEIRGITDPNVIRGANCVITDDETGSGETLAKAAEYLKSLGAAKVYVLVTHVTGMAEQAWKSEFIDEMIVTDTVPIKIPDNEITRAKVTRLSVRGELVAHLKSLEAARLGYDPRCLKRIGRLAEKKTS